MGAPRWLVPLLLAGAIAATYSNGLRVPFVFDDWHTIESNPAIRSLGRIPAYFVDPDTTTILHENKDLRPLLLVTMAANYQLSGLDPWSYHLVNLLLHWLVTLLIFRIVRDHLWLGDEAMPVAVGAALIVAVHPLNTEPVNYVSARSALLTAVFYLAAFDAAARDRPVRCVLLAACAMLTKSIAVSLPLVVLAHRLVARRSTGAASVEPLPWGLLAALTLTSVAGVAYRWLLLPPWIVATARQPDVTPRIYFQTQWSALLYYLRLFVWPDALVVDRLDYPLDALAVRAAGLGQPARARGARRRRVATGACAARVRLLRAVGGDHAGAGVEVLPARRGGERAPALPRHARPGDASPPSRLADRDRGRTASRRAARWVFAVGMTFVATLLAATAHARTDVWSDDLRLWLDATEKAPQNPRAWLNAGHAALARGDLPRARSLLLEAHRLSPCYAYIQLNLSAVEAREGTLPPRWRGRTRRCAATRAWRSREPSVPGRSSASGAPTRRSPSIARPPPSTP